ncbi:hypothetical protein BJ322DRAFT_1187493 [Thelephora terrestris]|uniref:Mediator of RNA polymerase II transcription subunit 25 n=1 Tax=Thelephora terrestris TaxID=56493 RepID=A0A9P6L840_9AGAM|nr:hypothetical protein BJ322DRAFT_1187493 [Thelephora terrestris]
MTSPSAAIDAIFNRPRDAAAILFLIEDSSSLASLWQHVRDAYLPSLLNAVQAANPTFAAETLWMITSQHAPFNPSSDNSGRRPPNDIPHISFSPHGETTISPMNVTSAIEALSATFGRGPATRHLVIVAAVNPSADVLGTRKNHAWSTVVDLSHREEIRVHLIVRSQSEMDGLTPLYWDLIGNGQADRPFTNDNKFAFYLHYLHDASGKGKASVVDKSRVPNSGSQPTTSIGNPSLVYRIQKMNGMERKRRSRTRRDQPSADRPGQPYQKRNLQTRAASSTTQPASPDPSSRSPSRREDTSHVSKSGMSPSYLDAFPPAISSDEHRSSYPSVTSPSCSSSPYYLGAATSPSSPGSRNISPSRAPSPIPTTAFDHFQHMALASQSAPDSCFSMSPSYHEFQSYGHVLDGSHLARQCSDVYGSSRSCWNEYNRQHGWMELSAYPRFLEPHPSSILTPRLAHQPGKISATSSFPPTLHDLDAPPAGNPDAKYFYPDFEDRAAGTSVQNTRLLTNCSPYADLPTTVPYNS